MHDGDAQLARTMLLHLEAVGHAALALDAVLERNAGQVALRVVIPGVIDAAEILAMLAAVFQADQRAAMGAAIFERVDFIVGVAGDDHRRVADVRRQEIARFGQFNFQREVMPVRPLEDFALLLCVNRLILKHPIRNAGETFRPRSRVRCFRRQNDLIHRRFLTLDLNFEYVRISNIYLIFRTL